MNALILRLIVGAVIVLVLLQFIGCLDMCLHAAGFFFCRL